MMEESPPGSPADPAPPPRGGGLVLPLDEDGVAWVSLGLGGGQSGALDERLLRGLDSLLWQLETLARAGRARAVVLQGVAPPATYLAGTDLDELARLPDAEAGAAWAVRAQRILRRLEELPLPTVAAVDGLCRGAGLELVLACAYRMASDSPATRFGLPEVRSGLIPGLGGTVRLPRLIGLQASIDLILSGRMVSVAEAERLGMVDEVVPPAQLGDAAGRFARERAERGRIRTGARRAVGRRLLEDTAPGRRVIFSRTARRLPPTAGGAPSAPRLALESMADGIALPLDRAFQHEAELFGQLLVSPSSRALAYATRLLVETRPAKPRAGSSPLGQAAVLGSSELGSQWAYLLARAGIRVRLKDPVRAAGTAALHTARARLARDAESGRLARSDALERSTFLSGTSGFGGFGTLELVVATAGEGTDALAAELREVEEHTRESCLLIAGSSLAEVSAVQRSLARPERLVGLRLSLPVDGFPLAEVVAGELTSERAFGEALNLARQLGRTALEAPDRRGAVADRLLAAYFSEATHLLDEGIGPEGVDEAAERFGMTLGPCRRMDAYGLQRAARLLSVLSVALGSRMAAAEILRPVVDSGNGLYLYGAGRPSGPNPLLRRTGGGETPVSDRLILRLVNEGALILGESLASPASIDLAAILGVGFPRAQGGLLFHADRLGPAGLVAALREAASRYGDRFDPAPLLRRVADEGGSLRTAGSTAGQP